MEIVNRDDLDVISEGLVEQITKEINENILNQIKEKFPCYWVPDKRKKYEDKFEVHVTGGGMMPYKILRFIYRLIEEDIHNGKIIRNDENYKYEISLDDIYKIVYIYDPIFDKDKVIRYHKTNGEHENLYVPYKLDLVNIPTYGNFDKNKTIISKYYIHKDDFDK